MRVDDWLRRSGTLHPDTVALDDGRVSLSYAELDRRASEVAGRLFGAGIEPGTVALLSLGEGLDKLVQIHALIRLGVTFVPVELDLPEEEMVQIREAVEPDHEITPTDGMTGQVATVPEVGRIEVDALLCRILTGGSTGRPRAIGLTHQNFFMSAAGSALNLGLERRDRWLCAVSLSHVSGLAIAMRSVIYGTGMFLADRFEPDSVGSAVSRNGATAISLVPTMLRRLLEAGVHLGGLRFALLGGAPIEQDLVIDAARAGIPVIPTYGLTEACSQVATSTPEIAGSNPGSSGRPIPGTEVRVEDDEILVRGPTVSPDALSPDGWLRTGDLGRLDGDGLLYVLGRRNRMIITGGENVQPSEVEGVLSNHSGVSEVVVFGAPDPEWQEVVVAAVVPTVDARLSEEELKRACSESLARFKVPRTLIFVDSIPRTRAGKIDYEALASLYRKQGT